MVPEDPAPVVKEPETNVTEPPSDNGEKVKIINLISIKKSLVNRKKMTMKMKKIKVKKNQIQVMVGLDLIIHGHKHSKKSM